jgi:hypothetical protein
MRIKEQQPVFIGKSNSNESVKLDVLGEVNEATPSANRKQLLKELIESKKRCL